MSSADQDSIIITVQCIWCTLLRFKGARQKIYLRLGYIILKVGNDSNVGANLKMADKSCIKKSAIGSNCTIGDNVKINNSIIMDNVTIRDG